MKDLERLAFLPTSLAGSAERLTRFTNIPNVPEMFIAKERSILERRLVQLTEIAEFGDCPGWSSETIHD